MQQNSGDIFHYLQLSAKIPAKHAISGTCIGVAMERGSGLHKNFLAWYAHLQSEFLLLCKKNRPPEERLDRHGMGGL